MHMKLQIQIILFLNLIIIDKVLCKLPTLTGDKPDHYEERWGIFWKTLPEAQRIDGDILVPADTPARNLRYFFDYTNKGPYPYESIDSDKHFPWLQKETNCKSIFETGIMRIREYGFQWDWGKAHYYYSDQNHRDEIVLPSNEGLEQFPLTRIRSCCGKNCPDTNLESGVLDRIWFYVYRPEDKQKYLTGACEFCALKAGITSCNNGYYASDYLIVEPVCNKFSEDTCYDSEYVFYRRVSINLIPSPAKNALLEHGIHALEHRRAPGKDLFDGRDAISYVYVFRQVPEAGFTVAVGDQTANLRPAPGNPPHS